jgi:hypothetical protein
LHSFAIVILERERERESILRHLRL